MSVTFFTCIFLYMIYFLYYMNVLSLKMNKIQNINDDNIYISCKKYSQSVSWYNKEMKIILDFYPLRGISHRYSCYVFAEVIWKVTAAAAESDKFLGWPHLIQEAFWTRQQGLVCFVHLLLGSRAQATSNHFSEASVLMQSVSALSS